jgi:hypothetical protein
MSRSAFITFGPDAISFGVGMVVGMCFIRGMGVSEPRDVSTIQMLSNMVDTILSQSTCHRQRAIMLAAIKGSILAYLDDQKQ